MTKFINKKIRKQDLEDLFQNALNATVFLAEMNGDASPDEFMILEIAESLLEDRKRLELAAAICTSVRAGELKAYSEMIEALDLEKEFNKWCDNDDHLEEAVDANVEMLVARARTIEHLEGDSEDELFSSGAGLLSGLGGTPRASRDEEDELDEEFIAGLQNAGKR